MIALTITGAGGYIGSSVAAAADRAGVRDLRCVIRRPAADLPGQAVMVENLREEAEAALTGSEAVVHLAAANEVRTADDPDKALAEATATAGAVARACAVGGVKRLVYVSTVHVYGDALRPGTVIGEDTAPLPRDSYASARLSSEQAIAAQAGECEVTVLRLTNAVGPPARSSVDRWTLVANDLCLQAARGGDLSLRSTGLQWRDFVPMSDVAHVILGAAEGRIRPGTFNLGSGHAMTVLQLAHLVATAAVALGISRPAVIPGSGGPVEQSPPFRISVERLVREGFAPRGDLAREVQDTIAFCRRQSGLIGGAV